VTLAPCFMRCPRGASTAAVTAGKCMNLLYSTVGPWNMMRGAQVFEPLGNRRRRTEMFAPPESVPSRLVPLSGGRRRTPGVGEGTTRSKKRSQKRAVSD
jgi:hypothetical protein